MSSVEKLFSSVDSWCSMWCHLWKVLHTCMTVSDLHILPPGLEIILVKDLAANFNGKCYHVQGLHPWQAG